MPSAVRTRRYSRRAIGWSKVSVWEKRSAMAWPRTSRAAAHIFPGVDAERLEAVIKAVCVVHGHLGEMRRGRIIPAPGCLPETYQSSRAGAASPPALRGLR